MISKPTVLVLGAGASAPFGFPTGAALGKKVLSGLLNKESNDYKSLRAICEITTGEVSEQFFEKSIDEFAAALRDSGKSSVDAFLEHRPEYIVLGKAAIAQALIPSEERASLLPARDWYGHLASALNTDFDTYQDNALSVVTFNYDRSLEHFLFTTLQNSYGKPSASVGRRS